MFPCRSLPPSFRFASSFPCVTSVLSFHVLYSVRCFFPFVSTLRVVSTLRFRSLRFFPFISRFPYYALLASARFKSYIPFVSSSLSFQLFPAVCSVLPSDLILPVSSQLFLSLRCVLSFMSSLLFHLLLPFFRITVTLMSCSFRFSFRFNSSFLFVASAPSSFFRFNSPLPFVTSFLSHKLLCPDRSVFPSVSTLPFYSLRL